MKLAARQHRQDRAVVALAPARIVISTSEPGSDTQVSAPEEIAQAIPLDPTQNLLNLLLDPLLPQAIQPEPVVTTVPLSLVPLGILKTNEVLTKFFQPLCLRQHHMDIERIISQQKHLYQTYQSAA